MNRCPYEPDVFVDVLLSAGVSVRGYFSTGPLVEAAGLWTLELDTQGERWVDVNPAHIVSVRVVLDD